MNSNDRKRRAHAKLMRQRDTARQVRKLTRRFQRLAAMLTSSVQEATLRLHDLTVHFRRLAQVKRSGGEGGA